MNKNRTLYFLKDSSSGKYYINASLELGDFEDAVIHTTLNSVKAGVKRRIKMLKDRSQMEIDSGWNKDDLSSLKKEKKEAEKLCKTKNCSIEIVECVISV